MHDSFTFFFLSICELCDTLSSNGVEEETKLLAKLVLSERHIFCYTRRTMSKQTCLASYKGG